MQTPCFANNHKCVLSSVLLEYTLRCIQTKLMTILNEQNVFCCPHCKEQLDMHDIMDNFVFTDTMEKEELKAYNVKTKQIATNLKNLRIDRIIANECKQKH